MTLLTAFGPKRPVASASVHLGGVVESRGVEPLTCPLDRNGLHIASTRGPVSGSAADIASVVVLGAVVAAAIAGAFGLLEVAVLGVAATLAGAS